MPLAVEGMQNTMRALQKAERDVRLGIRKELREAAEPVARHAETLAYTRIRHMRRSPQWARMRVGVTQKLVYVAPREKGTRGRGDPGRRRGQGFATPDFATLMATRAMEPALARHGPHVTAEIARMLDEMAARFNRTP